ncbi:MAG TPA: class I SAM-dependent methyltransferase family protein [Thermoanaerobaculia bacterium]
MKASPSFEELQRPLPPASPRRLLYAGIRLFLRTIGNLSDGIRIGNTYGFDSGVMLDYVYKNRASGRLGIGRVFDRVYLDSVGWRGIRARRELVAEVLGKVLAEQLAKRRKVRFLDVACGGGEYDLAALAGFPSDAIEAELRDYKPENIEAARANAARRGLTRVRFRQADAFDAANYTESWDVVVVSGLWEIIPDDVLVRGGLQHAARALSTGGALLFTVQPDHPQLELIARTLTSNTGKPWIMRVRSLALFESWLAEAGLASVLHRMEANGIFGVVVAVKPDAA